MEGYLAVSKLTQRVSKHFCGATECQHCSDGDHVA